MAACDLVHSFSVSHVEITSGRSSCWKVFTSFFTYTSSCFRLSFGLLGLFVRTFSPLRHLGSSELPDHFRGQELCPDAAATGKVGPPATWHPEMLSSRLGGNLDPPPLFRLKNTCYSEPRSSSQAHANHRTGVNQFLVSEDAKQVRRTRGFSCS